MSKKSILFIILTATIFSFSFAQKATFMGKVIDKETGEALIAANISLNGQGTTTDFDGAFSIQLENGNYDLVISYVSYNDYKEQITLSGGETRTITIELEPIATILNTATVTSGKYETPLSEVTVSLEVLQPELVESTNKTSIDEALQKVPGVTVIDGQANIRGGSGFSQGAGSRVLLLVDDMPILQYDSGFPNWDDVPVENIAQIEVVKGAASALYGSAALNGIINVRTAYAKSKPVTKVAAFYNTIFSPEDPKNKWWDSAPQGYGASFAHRQKIDKLDLVLGGFYLNKESANEGTYKEFGRFNFSTRYRFTDRLSVTLNGNFNKGERNSFFYWASADQRHRGDTSTYSKNDRFRYNIDPVVTFFDKKGNRHKLMTRYYKVDNNITGGRSNESYALYGEYQFQRKFKKLNLVTTAGLVATGNSVTADLYGDTTFTARNLAAYAQLDKKITDRLNVSAGFRFENNVLKNPGFEYNQGRTTVDPSEDEESKPVLRLGLNYRVTDFTFVRASWGQGYRYPTIAEKYIFTDVGGFFVVPNPALQSETGWSTELGIKQGFKVGELEGYLDIAAFLMRFEDMIEFNAVRNAMLGTAFSATDIGDTEIKGIEISLAGRGKIFGLQTSFIGGYTYVDPRFGQFDNTPIGTGERTIAQVNATNSTSNENILKYRSKHNFKMDLETQVSNLSIGLAAFYSSKVEAMDFLLAWVVPGLANYFVEDNDLNKGYTLFNGRLAYQFNEHIKASLILENIFNIEYFIRPALLENPRNLTARVDYKF